MYCSKCNLKYMVWCVTILERLLSNGLTVFILALMERLCDNTILHVSSDVSKAWWVVQCHAFLSFISLFSLSEFFKQVI